MSDTSFYYIVAEIDRTPCYVACDGSYTDDFDMALRFDDREAAEYYRTAMSEKYKTAMSEKYKSKVLRFTA